MKQDRPMIAALIWAFAGFVVAALVLGAYLQSGSRNTIQTDEELDAHARARS